MCALKQQRLLGATVTGERDLTAFVYCPRASCIMKPRQLDRYEYSPETAEIYAALGIENTTYEIGFGEVQRLLGDIRGKSFLDFGCGAGRTGELLRLLGARTVYAVDHDCNMISVAQKKLLPGIEFMTISDRIP